VSILSIVLPNPLIAPPIISRLVSMKGPDTGNVSSFTYPVSPNQTGLCTMPNEKRKRAMYPML
ncbi:hypothetical protein E2320_022733, partial [Naja naja]